MKTSRVKLLLAFAAIYVIWGSTYLAIRYAIETIPPFFMRYWPLAGTFFSKKQIRPGKLFLKEYSPACPLLFSTKAGPRNTRNTRKLGVGVPATCVSRVCPFIGRGLWPSSFINN
jgi:hypothetical protein